MLISSINHLSATMLYDALQFLVNKFHTAHSRLLQASNLPFHEQFKRHFGHKQRWPRTLQCALSKKSSSTTIKLRPSMLLNCPCSPVRQRLWSHGNTALYKFCIIIIISSFIFSVKVHFIISRSPSSFKIVELISRSQLQNGGSVQVCAPLRHSLTFKMLLKKATKAKAFNSRSKASLWTFMPRTTYKWIFPTNA